MEQKPNTISYDATLEELVDASVRLIAKSDALRGARTKEIIVVPAISGAALFVALMFAATRVTPSVILVGVFLAVAVGVVCAFVYPRVYDRTVRQRIRGLVRERLAGAESVHCEIELRPDVLWLRQGGVELAFLWNEASTVNETADAIELWFKGGLVIAPNRAFSTDADRHSFLGQARDFVRT